jgi:hypothetical protein
MCSQYLAKTWSIWWENSFFSERELGTGEVRDDHEAIVRPAPDVSIPRARHTHHHVMARELPRRLCADLMPRN